MNNINSSCDYIMYPIKTYYRDFTSKEQSIILDKIMKIEKRHLTFTNEYNGQFGTTDFLFVENLYQYIFVEDAVWEDYAAGKQTNISISLSTFDEKELDFKEVAVRTSRVDALPRLFQFLDPINDLGALSLKKISSSKNSGLRILIPYHEVDVYDRMQDL